MAVAKTLVLNIIAPDDVDNETLMGYAEFLKRDLLDDDDEMYAGEPGWVVMYTVRPSTEQESQVLDAQGVNDADDSRNS